MTCPHANNQTCETSAVCPVKVYLANLAVLNAKLHNLHWNVVGRAFIQVHEYTEGLYDELFEQFDAVAEAMKMRGGFPPVRLSEFLKIATVEELDARDFSVSEVLQIVTEDVLRRSPKKFAKAPTRWATTCFRLSLTATLKATPSACGSSRRCRRTAAAAVKNSPAAATTKSR